MNLATSHHIPNRLPPEHARDDFDFGYADGVTGPIRSGPVVNPLACVNIPGLVWCKRHGWEEEVFADEHA